MRSRLALCLACLPLLASLACQGTAPVPRSPATRVGQDATTFFKTEVKDPYRWLEDGSSAEVKDWIREQNEYAESVLGAFPDGKEIADRVRQLATTSPVRSAARMRGGVLFFLRETPPQPTPVLVAQKWPGGEERTIVDLNAEGGHQVITDYWPSPSGHRVAFGTAEGGSELTTIHFLDVETGKTFADPLPYAGGGTSPPALAWDPDEGGVIYMRFPIPPAGQPMSQFDAALFHHAFDKSTPDAAALGQDYSHIAEYRLLTSADGKQMAALAKKGDGGPWDVFVRSGDGWKHALDGSAGVTTASYVGDRLLVVATADAPNGRILALTPDGKETELLAEGKEAIESVAPIGDGFLVVHCWGPDWRVDQYDATGAVVRQVPLPEEGIQIAQVASQAGADAALIAYSGWTTPATWVSYDGRTGKTETVFEVKPAADYSKVRVDRIEATSKDGTTLPVVVLSLDRNEGAGPAPAILTGYGGFDVYFAPRFIGSRLAWLERGGVLAFANLRGGGEFGEAWHEAGKGVKKQNVFDDFYAAAQALIDKGWTTTGLLGAEGASNGGLLMGAELTQHPETYHAIVSFVGIYDMTRHEIFPNGAYNVTEYGSTSDEADFAALYAYSPLHHVVSGTQYPAVLLETGVNDSRVAPWQSRKFAAALQAAATGDRPILLVTREDAGHGVGAPFSQRVGNDALALTFFAGELR